MPESTSSGPEPAKPFETLAELRRAFADARYSPTVNGADNQAHDPKYREAVLARMALTAPALGPGGGGLRNE